MKKTFILDTNVLLHDPNSIFGFEENNIIIPIYVVEEIDTFKKELSELGQNARLISRKLDELRLNGSLSKGIALPNGGFLRVASIKKPIALGGALQTQDNLILALALEIKENLSGQEEVVFITQDINLRIKADAYGLMASSFEPEPHISDELYSGYQELSKMPLEKDLGETFKLMHNEFAIVKSFEKEKPINIYMRYCEKNKKLKNLAKQGQIWGISARNQEQIFALDLLLDDEVQLITLVGQAGTGKTLLAMAAGLHLVAQERRFQKLLVSRPIFPLGKDLGYLPGTVEEKLNPWMQPIFDNIEFLMSQSSSSYNRHRPKTNYQDLIDVGLLQIEPLTYIRGRSIASQFLIVDEAQNLTPHEVKTIISRAGEGTKVILTGDPYQIDNPYVDATNNGLVHVVNRFKGQKLSGHVTLKKGERSILAEMAAKLL